MRTMIRTALTAVAALALVALAAMIPEFMHGTPGLLMATALLAKPELEKKSKNLKALVGELKSIQDKHKGTAMPTDVASDFEAKAEEAKAIQDEIDAHNEAMKSDEARRNRIKGFEGTLGAIPGGVLPGGDDLDSKGGEDVVDFFDPGRDIVGYLPIGKAFVESETFRNYLERGQPQAGSDPLFVKSLEDGFLPVTKSDLETKAVPTLGAGVIRPERYAEIVRSSGAEREILTLRSLLDVQRTSSNQVEYTVFDSFTRAAAEVEQPNPKAEATMSISVANAAVRTVAAWVPVTEQQLQDAPQVEGLIENELTFDLNLREEEVGLWGDGVAPNVQGLFNTPGVGAITRDTTGKTNLDIIRMLITDVRVAKGQPNGVMLHPYDWEDIVLLKGSDERYVWVVVTTPEGDRVWNLRVVESTNMEDPLSGAGTAARRILVGDFRRGATLYDRMTASVAMGWINDQFIRNQRTIRAEKRIALAVKRPHFFRYHETQAAVA